MTLKHMPCGKQINITPIENEQAYGKISKKKKTIFLYSMIFC